MKSSRAGGGRLPVRQRRRLLVPVPRKPGPERRRQRPLGHRHHQVPGLRQHQRHQGRRRPRARRRPAVRPLRHARRLQAGRRAEQPDPRHVVPRRRHRDHDRGEELQLQGHGRHRLQQARRAGVHQLLGERVRLVGRGLREDRRRRHLRRPRHPGLVQGACADRAPDPPGAVQQPGHRQRLDLAAVLQRLAHQRRHRVLQQLHHGRDAHRLGPRAEPVRAGRLVAAVRRARRVQRLRLPGGRQRLLDRPHRRRAAVADEPVGAGREPADPGHRPDEAELHRTRLPEERSRPGCRPGRDRCLAHREQRQPAGLQQEGEGRQRHHRPVQLQRDRVDDRERPAVGRRDLRQRRPRPTCGAARRSGPSAGRTASRSAPAR